MPPEQDRDVNLLEYFREDAGLVRRLRLESGGYAFDELLPYDMDSGYVNGYVKEY